MAVRETWQCGCRQTLDHLPLMPFSSARPSRRQTCWSCCTSCTTSWPSKQVSSHHDQPAPPVPLASRAKAAQPPLRHILSSPVGVQFRPGYCFSNSSLDPQKHGPPGRYEILSHHALGPCVGWKDPGLRDPLDLRHWSQVVCGRPEAEVLLHRRSE